jgi:hypothetical protein
MVDKYLIFNDEKGNLQVVKNEQDGEWMFRAEVNSFFDIQNRSYKKRLYLAILVSFFLGMGVALLIHHFVVAKPV